MKASLEGVTALILDMKDLAYLSSAGLRVILSARAWYKCHYHPWAQRRVCGRQGYHHHDVQTQ